MKESDIKFVARHYRQGAFSTSAGWRKLGITASTWWSKSKIAAAIAGVVVLGATASIIINRHFITGTSASNEITTSTPATTHIVKAIDFVDTPLPAVVEEINRVYDVNVTNLPDEASSYRLTLHYQGNATDLINTINDILDTDMQIEE